VPSPVEQGDVLHVAPLPVPRLMVMREEALAQVRHQRQDHPGNRRCQLGQRIVICHLDINMRVAIDSYSICRSVIFIRMEMAYNKG